MIHILPRKLVGAAVLALLVLALAGCGRRGALEPPPGAQLTSPMQVPVTPSLDEASDAPPPAPATAPTGEPAKPAKPTKPEPTTTPIFKSFFLAPFVD